MNYHIVRGVTVLNLKVQELQLSYSWNRMLYLETSILNLINKYNGLKVDFKITFVVHFNPAPYPKKGGKTEAKIHVQANKNFQSLLSLF